MCFVPFFMRETGRERRVARGEFDVRLTYEYI